MAAIGETMTEEPRRHSRQQTPAPRRAAGTQMMPDMPAAAPPQASAGMAYSADAPSESGAGEPTRRRRPTPKLKRTDGAEQSRTVTDAGEAADAPPEARRLAPARRRSAARVRESNILGLGEQAHPLAEQRLPLPDPLIATLPEMRQALLDHALDEGLRLLTAGLAGALAPAIAEAWIADPPSWASENGRGGVGGLELFPALRPRAAARAGEPSGTPTTETSGATPAASSTRARSPLAADPLIEEVAETRRPVVLFGADESSLAVGWVRHLPDVTATVAQAEAQAEEAVPRRIGTLAAYPLRARGQFLGVLAVAAGTRLSTRHLGALEELADLAALAVDRDRLLSYSRSQEALAQTVVRHTPVAMAVLTGPEHTFALTNPTFARLLGLESEPQLTGKRLRDVAPERAEALEVSLRLDAVYAAGEPQAMVEIPIHLDRGMTYWNVMSSPLPGVSSSVGGVLVAAVDVTRQVTARLRSQEAAEVAQERIGQMMTLHATSLAVASQLGADPRELLADILRRSISLLDARAGTVYVRDSRHDDLEVTVCEGLRGEYVGSRIRVGEGLAGRVALTGQGLIVDDYRAYPFRAAIYDDEAFSAVIAVPLIHRGQVVGVLDVLDDAERRVFSDDDLWLLDLFAAQAAQAIENARTYVELEHAYRKQRELDRMKDDFIATASHELRTPLTGVQGFLDLLQDYPGSRDEPLALDFLRKASDSALELAEIAERLLQTSRLDTGRIELHLGPVRLATVVEEALRSFRELQAAQGQTHELIAEVPPELYVRADLGRLNEALDNLVSNAIKYSPKGGQVVVRCGPASFTEVERASKSSGLGKDGKDDNAIEDRPTLVLPHLPADMADPEADPGAPLPAIVEAAARQPFALITVSDQGMGIPLGERPRLFGRFARMESARASQIRGTGLGLYICRQTVRAMGGDVWLAASEPGQGSTFALALPADLSANP